MSKIGATSIEVVVWSVAAVGAAIMVIAGFVWLSTRMDYNPSPVPLGWATFGLWLAVAATVPALLLTGVRALLNEHRRG